MFDDIKFGVIEMNGKWGVADSKYHAYGKNESIVVLYDDI